MKVEIDIIQQSPDGRIELAPYLDLLSRYLGQSPGAPSAREGQGGRYKEKEISTTVSLLGAPVTL